MMNTRHETWLEIGPVEEHLTVFLKLDEALERFLGGSFSREPYVIRTDSGSVERSSRAQISDAVDSLGGSLDTLRVRYAGPGSGCRVSLGVTPYPAAYPRNTIYCSLGVFGDDETETNGRFDTLRNRMDAEIKRLPKPKAAEPVTAPQQEPVPPIVSPPAVSPRPATAPSAPASSAGGVKQWLVGFLRHPTGSQIVGTLVAAGVLALGGILWKLLFG